MRRLHRTRPLLSLTALWASPGVALAEPTCGTDQNTTCGLQHILHMLYYAAGILGAVFLLIVALVVRYYVRMRRANLEAE